MSREIPRNAPYLFIVAESFKFPAASILLDPQDFRGSEAGLRAPGMPRVSEVLPAMERLQLPVLQHVLRWGESASPPRATERAH